MNHTNHYPDVAAQLSKANPAILLITDENFNILWYSETLCGKFDDHALSSLLHWMPVSEHPAALYAIKNCEPCTVPVTNGEYAGKFLLLSPIRYGQQQLCVVRILEDSGHSEFSSYKASQEAELLKAMLSNSYREPMSTLFSALQLLENSKKRKTEQSVSDLLPVIENSTYRIFNTTDHLLHLYSASRSKQGKQQSSFHLSSVVTSMFQQGSLLLTKKGYQLQCDLNINDHAYAFGDAAEIETALARILKAVCFFAQQDRTIHITASAQNNIVTLQYSNAHNSLLDYTCSEVLEQNIVSVLQQADQIKTAMEYTTAVSQLRANRVNVYTQIDHDNLLTVNLMFRTEIHPSRQLNSGSVDYLGNRFSPLYVVFSDFMD